MFEIFQSKKQDLKWWYDNRDLIDFSPPYQRQGRLWSPKSKQYLIDSIINGYDVPKFYLADFSYAESTLNVGKKMYAVIDGKQRFEAIFDFINGSLRIANDFVYAADPTLSLAGVSYSELWDSNPGIASKFDSFALTVMTVVTDEEGRINELFLRLNASKPLTGPEIRNAMKGCVPALIRELADRDFFKSRVKFATDRGQGQDAAAKMLLVEYRGRLVDTKRKTLDGLVTQGFNEEAQVAESPVGAFERAKMRVDEVLARMEQIFQDADPLLRTQGSIVPYYWFIKNVDPAEDKYLRRFFLEFSESVVKNRRTLSDGGSVESADSELLAFSSFSRSINDSQSIEGRYEILLKRFHLWRRSVDDDKRAGTL